MYVAGWNQPGYLPDEDVSTFETFEEARSFIADEMQVFADDEYESGRDDESEEAVQAGIEIPKFSGPFQIEAGGWVFWVVKAG